MRAFDDSWRRRKSAAFDLHSSTAGKTIPLDLWGHRRQVYANANLSIYSAQACNAACRFCVEELRPASRGVDLRAQKQTERDDATYFENLERTLLALKPLDPSVSITGGEPSLDPRLPRILAVLARHHARKRTMTTNGSGLLRSHEGRPLIDWISGGGIAHLNISRAHPDHDRNAHLMRLDEGLTREELIEVVRRARRAGTRPRLSCVLLRGEIDDLDSVLEYLDHARSLGVDNVIFRQLMKTDPKTVQRNYVVRYSDHQRVALEPLLDAIGRSGAMSLQRQILGYYYYVEVWTYRGMDVCFEEADLTHLEQQKRTHPGVIHELVFHPNARLASSWQPWDGVLGPREDFWYAQP